METGQPEPHHPKHRQVPPVDESDAVFKAMREQLEHEEPAWAATILGDGVINPPDSFKAEQCAFGEEVS